MKTLPLDISTEALADFCRRNAMARLALFGSVLREDFTPDSDIDFLVDFLPSFVPGLLGMSRMERELSVLIGRKADLRTPGDLSKYFVDEVLREAVPVYVA